MTKIEDELSPEAIRTLRLALGLTLAEFGAELGVGLRAVQHWESGTRRPSAAAMILIRQVARKRRPKKEDRP